jgi:hypothetical protein
MDLAARGEETGCDEERVARQEETDEQPRLGEDDRGDAKEGVGSEPGDQTRDVVESLEEFSDELQAGLLPPLRGGAEEATV